MLTEKVVAQHEAVYTCSSDERYTNFEILFNLLARMSASDCEPTVDTYGTLVKGLCREGRYYEADQLADNMKEKGLSPNKEIYQSLLVGHCKNSKVDSAMKIFDLMAVGGFEPRLPEYKALICALCRGSQVEEAQAMFVSMLEKQWNADEVVWTVLIDGLLKEKQLDLCMKLLHIMESKNCELNFQTYVILAR